MGICINNGHVTLETTCGKGAGAKEIGVNHLIEDTLSPYYIILRKPSINVLEEVVSTMSMVINYPLLEGRVFTIRENQQIS